MTRVCVVLFVLASLAAPAIAQTPPGQFPAAPGVPVAPPRDNSPKTGTARIRGRVVAADTGQPLRKAIIRATSAELRENRMATTDAKGVYEITELPAGRYQITASKGSYVQLQYGQTRPFQAGKPLEIRDGQTADKVDFGLPRGSVLTGRVVDEAGEPATDVMVAAMRYQYLQGRRQLANAGRFATTNDLGEYRIYGLPPGDYYVQATLRQPGFDTASGSGDRDGYAPTFYPSSANAGEAQRVTLDVGQSRDGIDVGLRAARLARVSGTIVDAAGKPVTTGSLIVAQTSGPGFVSTSGGQIRPDGSFTVSNVAPGDYTVIVSSPQLSQALGSSEQVSANITVTGEDVTGVRLVGVKPSTLSGRIVLPPGAESTIRPTSLQLMANLLQATPFGGVSMGRVYDDWTFEIKSQPGQRSIRLAPFGSTTLSLKAVRLNGSDVIDTGVDVRANEDISGLEVELTNQQSEISGLVLDSRGNPSQEYSVLMFARDPARWTPATRYAGTSRPDQDGRFKVRGLPVGQYYAIALDYLEPGASGDPEFLERIRDRATAFGLNDGQVMTLDLKLVNGL